MLRIAIKAVGRSDEKRVLSVELFSRNVATVSRTSSQLTASREGRRGAGLTIRETSTERLEREETDEERDRNDLGNARQVTSATLATDEGGGLEAYPNDRESPDDNL